MDDPVAPLSANELTKTIVWLGSLVQRWGAQRTTQLDGHQLNFSQICILYQVRYGVTTPGAIAKAMMVTPRAITAQVDGLVEQRLLKRLDDPRDRRVVRLRITPGGERVSRDVEDRVVAPMARRVDALPPDELATLQRATEILRTVFQDIQSDLDPR